jgi:hypothetical protein
MLCGVMLEALWSIDTWLNRLRENVIRVRRLEG